ncbi:hypothetical protein YC2023_015013 [Brassica napus]
MKRKRNLDKGVSNKENRPLHPYENIATAGIRDEQSIYRTTRRLCEGVSKHHSTTSIGSIDEQIYNTPKTSRNKRKGFSARDLNRGEGNEEHVKKPNKQRTTQLPVPISPSLGLFGSIERKISTTPKTPANKHMRKIVIEEIDDSLEFDYSSQESSGTESEDAHFDDSVEPETCSPHTEFHKDSFIDSRTSTRATKRYKTKTCRKDDDFIAARIRTLLSEAHCNLLPNNFIPIIVHVILFNKFGFFSCNHKFSRLRENCIERTIAITSIQRDLY